MAPYLSRCYQPVLWFAARITFALIWLSCTVAGFVQWVDKYDDPPELWFTQFSYWSAMVESLYFIFAAVTTGMAIFNKGKYSDDVTPWFANAAMHLYGLALIMSSYISIGFWAAVYDGSYTPTFITMLIHGGSMLLAFLDFALCRQPVILKNIWAVELMFVVFFTFSAIWSAAGWRNQDGEQYLYAYLDWRNYPAWSAGVVAGALLLVVPGAWLCLSVLCDLRDSTCCCWGKTQDSDNDAVDV